MKIRIIDCTDPLMWYSMKVGELVPYLGHCKEGYKSREDSGSVNIINVEDAEICADDGALLEPCTSR